MLDTCLVGDAKGKEAGETAIKVIVVMMTCETTTHLKIDSQGGASVVDEVDL